MWLEHPTSAQEVVGSIPIWNFFSVLLSTHNIISFKIQIMRR